MTTNSCYLPDWEDEIPSDVDRFVRDRDDERLHAWACSRRDPDLRACAHLAAFFMAHVALLEERVAELGGWAQASGSPRAFREPRAFHGPRLSGGGR